MAKLTFDTDKCKGCGLCVAVCPKKILCLDKETLNNKGYNPIACSDEAACIACGTCYRICPDCIITIEK